MWHLAENWLAGFSAAPAGLALEFATALVRFKKIGLVSVGNALQLGRRVILMIFRKRCRQRSVVLRCTPSVAAAWRSVCGCTIVSLKSSHLSFIRRRASDVPVKALNMCLQAWQR